MTDPKRDRWGRYILTDPDTGEEKPWTRVTTLASVLDSEFGLSKWKMRNVVLGLVTRPDLLDIAYASDPEDKQQLDELCEDALKAANTEVRANQGTALHKFTARIDTGDLSRNPRQWDADLKAYEVFKEENDIQTAPSLIERITVIPSLETAGTIDRIVKHENEPKIADLKTGGSLTHGGMSITIQLAMYSRGKGLWNEVTGKWSAMPPVSQTEGLVMYLPAGEASPELYRVNLELGWEMAKVAKMVYDWRKDKEMLVKDQDRISETGDGQ